MKITERLISPNIFSYFSKNVMVYEQDLSNNLLNVIIPQNEYFFFIIPYIFHNYTLSLQKNKSDSLLYIEFSPVLSENAKKIFFKRTKCDKSQ